MSELSFLGPYYGPQCDVDHIFYGEFRSKTAGYISKRSIPTNVYAGEMMVSVEVKKKFLNEYIFNKKNLLNVQ